MDDNRDITIFLKLKNARLLNKCDINICPICKKAILYKKAIIHHTNYNNTCVYNSERLICEKCCEQHYDKFNKCISLIVPIHGLCNTVIKK